MLKYKKIMVAAIILGALAGSWYVKPRHHNIDTLKTTAELRPIRSDPFADRLHQKITNIAGQTTSHPHPIIFDTDAASGGNQSG